MTFGRIGAWLGFGFTDGSHHIVFDLPSRTEGYRFQAETWVVWRGPKLHAGESHSVVLNEIRKLIQDHVSCFDLVDIQAAQLEINARLMKTLPFRVEDTLVVKVTPILRVAPACEEDLLKLNSVLRQCRFEEAVRQQAKARVRFLKEQILADPASIRLYLLAAGDGMIGKMPQEEELKNIAAEVGWWVKENQWVVVARLIHDYLLKLSDGQADELLKAFAAAVEAIGDEDCSKNIWSAKGADEVT